MAEVAQTLQKTESQVRQERMIVRAMIIQGSRSLHKTLCQ